MLEQLEKELEGLRALLNVISSRGWADTNELMQKSADIDEVTDLIMAKKKEIEAAKSAT